MAAKNRPQTPPRKSGQISGVHVMFAVILAVVLILAINFSSRITAAQPLQEAFVRVDSEIEQLQSEHARLSALRDYVMSDAYVERWAHDDGKMMRPGEILYVPVPSGVTVAESVPPPVVLAAIETTEQRTETWEMWWNLFFDEPPPEF